LIDVTEQSVTLLDMAQSGPTPQLPKPPTQHAAQQAGCGLVLTFEEDVEPDSLECQLTDKLIEALMLGQGPKAASALRELKELDGEPLKSLASLLDDSQVDDYLFPQRLEFRNRRRGKPKHQSSSNTLSTPEKKLIDALMRGDRGAAGAALRDMKQLRDEGLELVAQLLANSPNLVPRQLLFVYRRRGHPHHPLISGAWSFGRSLLFARAQAEMIQSGMKPKIEAAVAYVMEKTGCGRATVFNSLKRHRRKAG
jgi:hypothetical protein